MAKITVPKLQQMKRDNDKIACLTAYDATFTKVQNEAGVDVILVGDSLGMVLHGHRNTVPVKLKHIKYHMESVARVNDSSLLVADLPYMTYTSPELAIKNSMTLTQAGAEMVKLEGGEWLADTIHALTVRGVPVFAHIGLSGQSVYMCGGHKVQGRDEEQAKQILEDAKVLEQAGAQALILECIPHELAKTISEAVRIPTIGIGAGVHCDGQILVMHDMLGLGKQYKFTQDFLTGHPHGIVGAIQWYVQQVKASEFPTLEQSFS